MAGGALNDLIVVDGDVSLGGKLSVALSPGGNLDVGVYRVINYGGALSNPAGLMLGALPTGRLAPTTSFEPRWTSRST